MLTCAELQHKMFFYVTVDILKTYIKLGLPGVSPLSLSLLFSPRISHAYIHF